MPAGLLRPPPLERRAHCHSGAALTNRRMDCAGSRESNAWQIDRVTQGGTFSGSAFDLSIQYELYSQDSNAEPARQNQSWRRRRMMKTGPNASRQARDLSGRIAAG